jgi:hypothetical protein
VQAWPEAKISDPFAEAYPCRAALVTGQHSCVTIRFMNEDVISYTVTYWNMSIEILWPACTLGRDRHARVMTEVPVLD